MRELGRSIIPVFVLLFSACVVSAAQAAPNSNSQSAPGVVADKQASTPDPVAASPALPPVETASLYPMGNYSKVTLGNRKYEGKLFIEAYGVQIKGVQGSTIEGNVYVLANDFTMTGVTVNGDVVIVGSNANLTGCIIKGKVQSQGSNNKW